MTGSFYQKSGKDTNKNRPDSGFSLVIFAVRFALPCQPVDNDTDLQDLRRLQTALPDPL